MKNLNVMTDEELAMDYVNGNNRAFDELLFRHQSKLFSYILFVVRDREIADDLFQETFVKVITKLQEGKYSPSGKFSAWMMRIAHNVIMDLYRGLKVQKIVVTLNPSTPVFMLEDIIRDVDMVLLMSVNPGFGGQKFIENTIRKVERLRRLINETGSHALIEVDGGVQAETAPRLVKAGTDVLVSGSYVFKSTDPYTTIEALKKLK